RRRGHLFQGSDYRHSRILNADHRSKTSPNTQNLQSSMLTKHPTSFLYELVTRVVVPKASVDKINTVSTNFNGFKKCSRSRSRTSYFPYSATIKGSRDVICLEKCWWCFDIGLCYCEDHSVVY